MHPDGSTGATRREESGQESVSIFSDGNGTPLMTSEQGLVLRSTDDGAAWDYVKTGYSGSLWTGICLRDGMLLGADCVAVC